MLVVNSRHFLIGLTMLAAACLALALTPRLKMADQGPKINLEAIIPKQFGGWKLQEALTIPVADPGVLAELNRIYDQLLTRHYVNEKGELIMLSIAYGSNQSYSTQVHQPEMCYPPQGFQIKSLSKGFINFSWGKLPVMRLIATKGPRVEPITYWVMIGESPVRGNVEQQFARWKYGLSGKIPTGIVIRVSTISANESKSFRTEEQFVRDMLAAVSMEYRKILAGLAP